MTNAQQSVFPARRSPLDQDNVGSFAAVGRGNKEQCQGERKQNQFPLWIKSSGLKQIKTTLRSVNLPVLSQSLCSPQFTWQAPKQQNKRVTTKISQGPVSRHSDRGQPSPSICFGQGEVTTGNLLWSMDQEASWTRICMVIWEAKPLNSLLPWFFCLDENILKQESPIFEMRASETKKMHTCFNPPVFLFIFD